MFRSTTMVLGMYLMLLSSAAFATEPTKVSLDSGETLELMLPTGWQATKSNSSGVGDTIKFLSGATDFEVTMVLLPFLPYSKLNSNETVRAFLVEEGNQLLPRATQKQLEVSETKSEHGTVFFFHITDSQPEKKKGDYREMCKGAMLLGQRVLTVTVLTHTGDSATVNQAKQMVSSALISPKH